MLCIYCPNPNCAEPNHYSMNKPIFCGFCGTKLDSLAVGKVKNHSQDDEEEEVIKKPKKQRTTLHEENIARFRNKKLGKNISRHTEEEVEDVDSNDDDYFEPPDLENLKYDIIGQRQKITLGQLAQEKKTGFAPRQVEKLSQTEVIKQFQEEAKSKSKPIDIGDVED